MEGDATSRYVPQLHGAVGRRRGRDCERTGESGIVADVVPFTRPVIRITVERLWRHLVALHSTHKVRIEQVSWGVRVDS